MVYHISAEKTNELFLYGQLPTLHSIYCSMKRVISLLLTILLLLWGCRPARQVARGYLRGDTTNDPRQGETAFSDMVLSYPDPDGVAAILDRALEEVSSSEDARAYESVYEEQLSAYNRLIGAASLAYVRYCQDITDEERAGEYARLSGALYAIEHRLARLEKELMDRFGYHRERGAAYADALSRFSRQSTEQFSALRSREDELCRRYERLDHQYEVTYLGRTWTIKELMADNELSLPEFLEALELYQRGKNQAAGELFLSLISLRNRMAREGGFSSYAAAQYASFGREYTPEQALDAAQAVKEVFAPLYIRLRERCENDLRYLSGASFGEGPFLTAMEQALDRTVPGAGEAWRYMLRNELYDSRPSEKKLSGSFTTYLSSYGCPFLFTQWEDDAASVFTVIHEFGHFLSYYWNPEGTYYGAENLDLAETDAQGLELLMLGEYDAIFGRYAAAARLCLLTNALYALLSGFMEDEFQQRAYALNDPSVADLNGLYGRLAQEYGFDRLFGYEGREWTEIGHTFQFPFYYVSYGVSMLGAMSIAERGERAYRRVLKRKAGTTFSEAVGRDVLSEASIRALAIRIEQMADVCLQEQSGKDSEG